jgi:hypothetical protein
MRMSSTLFPTDAEDRALLESNPSAVIGDDVALGRVVTRLCPESSRPTGYIVLNAINSFIVHNRSLAVRQNSVRTPQMLTNFRHEVVSKCLTHTVLSVNFIQGVNKDMYGSVTGSRCDLLD